MSDPDSVGLLAYDGVDGRALVSVHDFLVRASRRGCAVAPTVYSLVPSDRVSSSTGLGIEPDDVLIGTPGVVVVPGGRTADGDPTYPTELPERVGQLSEAGATLVGIGSGALALGEAGLLADRRATTAAPFRDALGSHAVSVVDGPVVESGGVITATGADDAPEVVGRLLDAVCSEEERSRVGAGEN
ncbi:MAG: DJ-1/PfpI family protein [Halanaeroarchaeum sp.]